MVCAEAPHFPSNLDRRTQIILQKIEQSPAVAIKTQLESDFSLEKLLEMRNIIFDAAKCHEQSNVQHGDRDAGTINDTCCRFDHEGMQIH